MIESIVAVVALILGIVALNKIAVLDRKMAKLKMEIWAPLNQAAQQKIAKPPVTTKTVNKTKTVAAAVTAPAEVLKQTELPKPVAIVAGEKPSNPRNLEQALASRWFVWIGGAAVALGGLLFIKYAHDQGLISPVLRLLLGLVLASVLVAAGEYVRRARGAEVTDYVPAALSAAGLMTGFGTIYAAHALYQVIPAGVAFIGLGLVAFAAFALARLQGPLIAALGLIGAYAAPALITSEHPNAWSFFPYLSVIVVASFYTLRGRTWWWLGYLAILGATAWSLLWVQGVATAAGDVLPVGLFALALGAVTTLLLEGRKIFAAEGGSLLAPASMSHR